MFFAMWFFSLKRWSGGNIVHTSSLITVDQLVPTC